MRPISRPIATLGRESPSEVFRRTGVNYDYALGAVGLFAATSREFPYSRATAPFRKDQFDASANPGEQSLSNWWLRSQSDFSGGAGITFMEPATDETVMASFAHSVGLDVWTPGQVSLLKKTTVKRTASGEVRVMGAIDGTTDIFYHAESSSFVRETATAENAVAWGGTGSILSMTNDGANYYVADSTGIYRGTLAGGAGSLLWNTGNSNVVIGWAKQRLVAGIGPDIYELTTGGPSLPASIYTHPSAAWKWTGITEGASAIFAAGYNGSESAIFKFILGTSGAMPTLTNGIVAATMPVGEQVHSIYAYLGAYIAIGTNKGVRIGLIDTNGDIIYGPLLIESDSPVYALTGEGRYIYAGATNAIDGNSGLWRIDLGAETSQGFFPYATDLSAGDTGTVRSVTLLGASGRLVFGVDGAGSYIEHETDLVTSGYLRTGYIRFNTVEPKQFQYARVRITGSGSVAVSTYDTAGTSSPVAVLDASIEEDFSLGRSAPEESLALVITLTQGSATAGPTMNSWQVKALPAATRSRIINLPVLIFERIRDNKGAMAPAVDVHALIADLEEIESEARGVLFTEFCSNPRSELVIIDEIRFQQITPPANCRGDGGIAYLTLRTIQ